jgi:ABC-type glycerol-3-phosphate transport system substrate-binding protein
MKLRKKMMAAVLAGLLALGAVACSSDDSGSDSATESTT